MIEVVREQHYAPAWVERALLRAGGRNWLGGPNFRAVWGWSRLSPIGGKWDVSDDHGNWRGEVFELRWEPRYLAFDRRGSLTFDRWHLEKWMPPATYGSPRQWYEQTLEWEDEANHGGRCLHSLGPYPSRGEYELCYTLETPGRDFLQLTPMVVEYLARAIEASRLPSPAVRMAALRRREEKKFEREVERNLDILDDVSPYLKGSYVSFAGMNAREMEGGA